MRMSWCWSGLRLRLLCVLDTDACINNPCDDNAVCTDTAAPALDDAAGRTCTCNAGYSGDGETGNCVGNIVLVNVNVHPCWYPAIVLVVLSICCNVCVCVCICVCHERRQRHTPHRHSYEDTDTHRETHLQRHTDRCLSVCVRSLCCLCCLRVFCLSTYAVGLLYCLIMLCPSLLCFYTSVYAVEIVCCALCLCHIPMLDVLAFLMTVPLPFCFWCTAVACAANSIGMYMPAVYCSCECYSCLISSVCLVFVCLICSLYLLCLWRVIF